MDIDHLLNLAGTLTTVTDGTTTDIYGDPTPMTTSTTVRYWVDDPGAKGEPGWSTEERRFFLPAGTVVTKGDRIVDRNDLTWELLAGSEHTDPRSGRDLYVSTRGKRVT